MLETKHKKFDMTTGDRRSNILLLFDVDGTLTPSRLDIEEKVDKYLQNLRNRVCVGLVGGSDIQKISQQTCPPFIRGDKSPLEACINRYDYVFAENGLVAYKNGSLLSKQSLVNHIGEEKLQTFINFCLGYMSKLQLPLKRGNFIEFRTGLINVCPVGRSCTQEERQQFNELDNIHKYREKFVKALQEKFGPNSEEPLGLTYSIGGQISFDAFPEGWDKRFCLDLVDTGFQEIHFFGDKTAPGGNDHEIFEDKRTIGHSVTSPEDTLRILESLQL